MKTKYTTPEMQLLILCTKVSPTSKDIIAIEHLLTVLDNTYSSLITLVYKHAMLPKFYATLLTYLPSHPIVSKLKPFYFNIVQKNMSMSSTLIKFVQLLHAHNIRVLCVKGPSLAKLIYKDITYRQYGDLDILIHKKDRKRIITLLETQRFHPEIRLHPRTKKTFFTAVNVLGFHTPKKDVFIEVHWELLSKNYAIVWDESALWEHPHTIDINNYSIRTLNHENNLLYLCIHGSKHLFERMAWVSDIDHFIQTQEDIQWEKIIARAKELGILRIVLLSLNLCQSLLDTPLPEMLIILISHDKTTQKLTQQLIEIQFSKNTKNTKNLHSFKLLWDMRENTSDKLKFVWHALFSAKFNDFKFIQLPNYLAFLYPFIRPLRLAIKYFK